MSGGGLFGPAVRATARKEPHAAKRSRPMPSLVVGDGRAIVQQRITF